MGLWGKEIYCGYRGEIPMGLWGKEIYGDYLGEIPMGSWAKNNLYWLKSWDSDWVVG
jgi:hypothetical protein